MGITLERCAEMRAEMDCGRRRDEVLARAGVGPDEWTAAQREWLDKMGAEIEIGRFALTNRYTAAFLERQRTFTVAPTASVVAVPVPMAAPAAAPSVVVHEASFVTAPAPVKPAGPGAPSGWANETVTDPVISPFHVPLPFVPAVTRAPGPLATPVQHPPGHPHPSTVGLPVMGAAAAPVLPFHAPAAPADETALPVPAPLRSALPFHAPPPGAALPAVARPSGPSRSAAANLGATVIGSVMPIPAAFALPFARGGDAPSPPPPVPTPPLATAAPAAAPPAAAPPPAGPVTLGGLTLEQHVSLCAELAHTPGAADAVLGRYRVTGAAKAEMDLAWKARFAADPALERKWHEAYRLYAAFLVARR